MFGKEVAKLPDVAPIGLKGLCSHAPLGFQ